MELMRDCLDKQLDDHNKRRMGRVDGIILDIEEGRQPQVAYVEVGVRTLLNRLSPRFANMVAGGLKTLGVSIEPYRIAWSKVKVGLNNVVVEVEAEKTPALEWELWLRKKVIGRIPGA
ncbi:MAG TPA: hypothetical protein VHS05_20780 [Pyrinomonadaceae bacterium]|jgi:hypothetical protein|nr:hypothetical protein [Pyrinomonadaceae bacterium]